MSNVRFFYIRDFDRNRHVCVARSVDLDKKLVTFAYSMSAPEDTFNKKLGRQMASERLMDPNSRFTVELATLLRPIETILAFFVESKDERLPESLVRLAKKEVCEIWDCYRRSKPWRRSK